MVKFSPNSYKFDSVFIRFTFGKEMHFTMVILFWPMIELCLYCYHENNKSSNYLSHTIVILCCLVTIMFGVEQLLNF